MLPQPMKLKEICNDHFQYESGQIYKSLSTHYYTVRRTLIIIVYSLCSNQNIYESQNRISVALYLVSKLLAK